MNKYIIKFKNDTFLYHLTFVNFVGAQKTVINCYECSEKGVAMVFCRKALAEAIAKALRGKVEEL